MEEESREVKLALESHILLIFGVYRKNVSITVRQVYLYFWYHCDAVEARKCRLGMTSSAAR